MAGDTDRDRRRLDDGQALLAARLHWMGYPIVNRPESYVIINGIAGT